MKIISMILVAILLIVCICVLTYVSYEKNEEGECDHCEGDCLHCGKTIHSGK